MKAIILAAGMGTRLLPYTKDLPKGMLPFLGKSLIEHQIHVLNTCGITDISIVKGYKPESIKFSNVKEFENKEYAHTNMVASLMCAKEELTGDVLIAYADIVYEPQVINTILHSNAEIAVAYDDNYQEYWKERLGSLESDSESFCITSDEVVTELGKPNPPINKMNGRYIGLIKLSNKGCKQFIEIYEKQRLITQADTPWYESPSFKKGYMTDMLQAIIDEGITVHGIPVQGGWLEFDTAEDYELYNQWYKDGTLNRFIDIQTIQNG